MLIYMTRPNWPTSSAATSEWINNKSDACLCFSSLKKPMFYLNNVNSSESLAYKI